MNYVASPVAPSVRIRGAASEPGTSQPQCLHPEEGAVARNQVGYSQREGRRW